MKKNIILSLVCLSFSFAVHAQVQLDQVDDFENGSTENWVEAIGSATSPNPPVNSPTGGPAGANDNFLQVSSGGGNGPGSRQVALNITQWTGDYIAAGIGRIQVDVANLEGAIVNLRVGFQDSQATRFVSTEAQVIPSDGQWQTLIFDISESAMTRVQGLRSYAQALGNVTEMRFISAANTSFIGDRVISTMGLDNITALGAAQQAVPPVAEAGVSQFVSDDDGNGVEDVTLDGSQSTDDGNIVSYEWFEEGQLLATGVNPTVSLGRGTRIITLRVTDDEGETAEDTVTITVGLFSVVDLREVPDTGGDAGNDLAILKVDQVSGTQDESINVQINDANTGALLRTFGFLNPDFGANGVNVYPGLGASGNPGIGVFASRRSDGLAIVQIKDSVTGALIRNVFPLSAAWIVSEIEAIPNVDGNGNYGVAALATNAQSGLMIVQLRDAASNTLVRNVFPLGFGWTPISFDIIADIGNGVPGIAVLAQRDNDQLTIVQIRSAADGSLVRNVFPLGFGFTPREMRVINDADGDGVSDIATRMTRDSDGLEVIQIRDSIGNSFVANHFPLPAPAWSTVLQSMQPVDNNGIDNLAVFSVRTADGQMLIQVRDTTTRSLTNNTFLIGPPWSPGLVYRAISDLNGNAASELAALVQNSTTRQNLVQIRDAITGAVLRNIFVNR